MKSDEKMNQVRRLTPLVGWVELFGNTSTPLHGLGKYSEIDPLWYFKGYGKWSKNASSFDLIHESFLVDGLARETRVLLDT